MATSSACDGDAQRVQVDVDVVLHRVVEGEAEPGRPGAAVLELQPHALVDDRLDVEDLGLLQEHTGREGDDELAAACRTALGGGHGRR